MLSREMKWLAVVSVAGLMAAAAGTACLMIALGVYRGRFPQPAPVSSKKVEPRPTEKAQPRPWEKIQPRLRQFDQSADAAANKRLQSVQLFFKQREPGAKKFAGEVLSWSGKWELVKDTVGVGDHRLYLAETFDRHLFSAQELQDLVHTAQKGYLSDLDGLENELLVQIRADLADSDLCRGSLHPHFASDEAFRQEYRRLAASLVPQLLRELKFTVGREILGFVVMDLGTQLTTEIGVAALIDLGVDASFLMRGFAGGVTTLGVGLVVGYLVDQALDWVLEQLGYTPEADIARQIVASMNQVRDRLIEGEAAALADHAKLERMARDDARQTLEQLEKSGRLGLRWQLRKLQEVRARLREEALRKLLEGAKP